MRVLLMPASYAPVLGGLQTAVHSLARGLAQRGHTVKVITNRHPRSLPRHEQVDGVDVERLYLLSPRLADLRRGRLDIFAASLLLWPTTLLTLLRRVREFQPDVINVHFPDNQLAFLPALRRQFKFRLVVSIHGHELLRYVNEPGYGEAPTRTRPVALCKLLREADAVTACSSWMLEKAISLEPGVAGHGRVIYNGVDLGRFSDRSAFHYPRPYAFAYGRLTHAKGFDLLVAAFARVAGDIPEMDLILAGAGEARRSLENLAETLGLGNRVLFWGRATSDEIVQLLNGCQFVVIPSRVEPFGIVALETLAAGKPLLATRVGGLAEIVQLADQQGYPARLVAATADEIARGLTEFHRSENSIIRIPATIGKMFSWEQNVEQFQALYEEPDA
ncbi:MAG: glycosyltransferase family 4 protein [Chloroflexota bacterium]